MEAHTKEWYEQYAKEHNLELSKFTDKVIARVNASDGYCPCKVAIWKKTKPEELDKIICPCSEHLKEIEETGHCHCFLFVKPENDQKQS